MNCVLFAKMDQVFSKENKTLKKYWKIGKKYWKSQGKVREFCQSGKVGTLFLLNEKPNEVSLTWGMPFMQISELVSMTLYDNLVPVLFIELHKIRMRSIWKRKEQGSCISLYITLITS